MKHYLRIDGGPLIHLATPQPGLLAIAFARMVRVVVEIWGRVGR